MKAEAGPGMPLARRLFDAEFATPRGPVVSSPWWYDYTTHEIVRTSDGARWSPRDVPELERSLHDRSNPVVDVDAVDRWVLAQTSKEK